MATIDSYSFGRIVIDGREHTKDVIVLPNRIRTDWWRRDGHGLVVEDLADVIDELPDNLVIGTGAYGRMKPDPAALDDFERRGINVEVLQTGDAVERYRSMNPAATAAALHLTC